MTLKAIALKIASWFKAETKHVEQDFAARISQLEAAVHANSVAVAAEAVARQIADSALGAPITSIVETAMSTPAAAPVAPAITNTNVDNAIKIALALKAIDDSLTVEQVQAGTNAALATLYPAAA